ncbi:MAG: eight-cysteine-cluster domain-containing protein [Nanoarchaeota archaeon]|nr:eight-cysteine-cluster domain-containing protein [Nanoarchaeota archaeon]
MKKVLILFLLLFIVGCTTEVPIIIEEPMEDFCGVSGGGECETAADCAATGCSGQVCLGVHEEGVITTCEWTECYDASRYGLGCGCVEGQCQWS